MFPGSTFDVEQSARRGIRRPTSDHSWNRDECLPKAKGKHSFRVVWSFQQVIAIRRGGTRRVSKRGTAGSRVVEQKRASWKTEDGGRDDKG